MNKPLSGISGGEIRSISHRNSGIKNTAKPNVSEAKKETTEVKDGVVLSGNQAPQEPQEPPKMVKVKTFPQDPFMDKPAVEEIEASKIGTSLNGPRVKAYDDKPVAIADPDGNFFYEPLDREFDQVNSYVCAYKTLDMHKNYLEDEIDWSFRSDQIDVYSHKDEGANAYYSRWGGSINFFYFESEGLEKTVQTSQSMDVVSHETGHAVLDGMKPNYFGGWGGETMAFHEAFADSTAMLYTLNREENIDKLVEETGGDLNTTNRLTMLAEEFGKAIKLMNDDPSDDNKTYLRNANNTFKYVPPSQLPEHGGRDELTSEAHSFSRVFSGAFYDAFKNLYAKFTEELPPITPPENGPVEEQNQQVPPNNGQEPQPVPDYKGAMVAARNVLGPILLKGVKMGPSSGANFKNIALSMINADKMINGGKFKQELVDAFVGRDILKPEDIPQNEAGIMANQVKLDTPVKTKEEALAFLKTNASKLGIDASQYSDAKVSTNKRGETTIEYDSVIEVPLNNHGIYKVAGVKDLYIDIHGGLTLGFDKDGNLGSKLSDDITPEKIQNTIKAVKKARSKGMVRRAPTIYKSKNIFKSKNTPYHAEVYQEPSGKMKIRRIPIIVS